MKLRVTCLVVVFFVVNTYTMNFFAPKRTDGEMLPTLKDLSQSEVLSPVFDIHCLASFIHKDKDAMNEVSKRWKGGICYIDSTRIKKTRDTFFSKRFYYDVYITGKLEYDSHTIVYNCCASGKRMKDFCKKYGCEYKKIDSFKVGADDVNFYQCKSSLLGYFYVRPFFFDKPEMFYGVSLIQSACNFVQKQNIQMSDLVTAADTLSLLKNKKVVPNPYYLLWMTQLRVGSERSNLFKEVFKKLVKYTRGAILFESFEKMGIDLKQARDLMYVQNVLIGCGAPPL